MTWLHSWDSVALAQARNERSSGSFLDVCAAVRCNVSLRIELVSCRSIQQERCDPEPVVPIRLSFGARNAHQKRFSPCPDRAALAALAAKCKRASATAGEVDPVRVVYCIIYG
jgi:hypothetical protein